jgi:hypothetical protein
LSTRAIHKNDNDLWKTLLLRFVSGFSRLPSPANGDVAGAFKKQLANIMHLVRCATPTEPLEDAPTTALLRDLTEGERWDGFWSSSSEAYYVRCTRVGGATEWFTLADEAPTAGSRAEVRVLAIHPKRKPARVSVVVARSPNGRRMLVGNAGRTSRQ